MAVLSGDFYSEILDMTTHINVIFPDISNDVTPVIYGEPKVLYLLHGLSANSGEWLRFSKIEYYAKKYNFIVIMPEVQRSFYCNTVYGANYFTFIAEELPDICKRWFNISNSKNNTYVCGESMGGYGAIKVALTYPEKFEGVGSLSGVLDIQRLIDSVMSGDETIIKPREIRSIFGVNNKVNRDSNVIELVKEVSKNKNRPRLIQICGLDDFLYNDNLKFKNIAEQAGYGHTYMEWNGDHEWSFWDTAIQRVFQFFCNMDIKKSRIY